MSTTNTAALAAAEKKPIFSANDVSQQAEAFLATSAAWLTSHWLQILIATGIATLIVLGLHLGRRWARRLCERSPGAVDWRVVIGRAAVRTNNFFIVMLAAKLVGDTFAFAAPPKEVADTISFLWTVAAAFQVAIWVRELILGGIEHRTSAETYHGEALASAMGLIRLLVTFALFAIALVVVLDNLGVNVTGLVAGLGVGGIAIGLAAKGIFDDLFAALAIIFDKPFRRGDTINYDQTTGTVESIGLKSTRIRSATGEERIISNKNLLDKEVQNLTRRDYRRVKFVLGLVQWTPVEQMERLPEMLKEVVEACGKTFVRAGFMTFNTSSYDFDVEFDSPEAAFQPFFDARHQVGLAIIKRLDDEGIALAYPTLTRFNAPEDADRPGAALPTTNSSGAAEGSRARVP
ncbi:mechanosensitive ion channel family protein [Sphingomonas sp.]|jgi:small-conductance mechanosensitive channel|uniref:mechanosensitive ion channel family protein n=1 Tax=Sphingomonas sp. TaxID=28214 RepID=UPI002D7F47E4|nr:mechanosensitive ion channel family protein [Sphingomonas sp.]HEU0043388.1 mechanosensitive ion channel family protein [Sphingomonas sp.]